MNGGSANGYPPFLMRKTLSKKLYITKSTPAQAKTATCWALGSAIRGTLTAKDIAVKERTPSALHQYVGRFRDCGYEGEHTHGGDNLGLKAELVLEATCKVADAATAITRHVWHLSNVVEHLATDEEEDRDQADGSPEVSALKHRQQIRPHQVKDSQAARGCDRRNDPSQPVNRPLDRWVWTVGRVAGEPLVDLLGRLGSTRQALVSDPDRRIRFPLED